MLQGSALVCHDEVDVTPLLQPLNMCKGTLAEHTETFLFWSFILLKWAGFVLPLLGGARNKTKRNDAMTFITLVTRGQQEAMGRSSLSPFLLGSIEFIHTSLWGNLGEECVSAFYSNILIFLMETHRGQVVTLGTSLSDFHLGAVFSHLRDPGQVIWAPCLTFLISKMGDNNNARFPELLKKSLIS